MVAPMETARIQLELNRLDALKRQKTADLDLLHQEIALKEIDVENALEEISSQELELRKQLRAARTSSLSLYSAGSIIPGIGNGYQTFSNYSSFPTLTPPATPAKAVSKKSKTTASVEFPVSAEFIVQNQQGTYLKAYGTVVFLSGSWYEICCHVCGGNTSPTSYRSNQFMKGIRGMKQHLTDYHAITAKDGADEDGQTFLSNEKVIALCSVRQLTAEDIRALCHRLPGVLPIEKVKCNITGARNSEGVQEEVKAIKLEGTVPGFNTLVKYSDDSMVELRCALCGANCYGGKSLRHYKGLSGFSGHLQNTHGQSYLDLEEPSVTKSEWIVAMCGYRKLTQEEVHNVQLMGPDGYKVDFVEDPDKALDQKAADPAEDTIVEIKPIDSSKPSVAVIHSLEENETEYTQPLRQSKRLRRTLSVGPEMEAFLKAINARPAFSSVDTGTIPAKLSPTLFAQDCPCTISGHPCGSQQCMRYKICILNEHGDACNPQDSHLAAQTCACMIFGNRCDANDAGTCSNGHDDMETRRQIFHDHDCVNH